MRDGERTRKKEGKDREKIFYHSRTSRVVKYFLSRSMRTPE